MFRSACIASVVLMSCLASLRAAELPALPPLPKAELPDGIQENLAGLDALEEGKYAVAAEHFTKAIDSDEDRPAYWLARGVAHALSEKLNEANRDLTRANRLAQGDNHVRLWLATVTAMAGDFEKDSTIYAVASRDPYEYAVRTMSRQYGELTFRQKAGHAPKDITVTPEEPAIPRVEPPKSKDEAAPIPKPAVRDPAPRPVPKTREERDAELRKQREEAQKKAIEDRERVIREAEEHDKKREQDQLAEQGKIYVAARRAALHSFPSLAKQFSARVKAGNASIARALLDRGIERYAKQDWAGAYGDLEFARQVSPEDVYVLFHHAGCALELGAPELALETYTAVLTAQPLLNEAYMGRSIAAARVGAAALATEDLAVVKRRAPQLEAKFRNRVNVDHSARGVTVQDLTAAVMRLHQSAAGGASFAQLRAEADAIAKASNAIRKRASVAYQRGLRLRVEAVEAQPQSADAHAALGEYLYSESSNTFGEAVEPRAAFKPYRPHSQVIRQRELAAAHASLDKALQLNPNQARALAFKAACLMEVYSARAWAGAQELLEKSLALKGDDPQVLGLFSVLMDKIAAMKAAQAADLRTADTWETTYWIYTRYPSREDLREADELDQQAERLWALGRKSLEQAAKTGKGTKWGAYFEGVIARMDRLGGPALAAFTEAVKLDADFIAAHQQLSVIYGQSGQAEQSFLSQARAVNVHHTTAAPLLKACWLSVSKSAMKAGRTALDRASEWDPADPRIAAYRGAIAQQSEKADEARAGFAAACALDAARAHLRGVNLGSSRAAISHEDAGFALALNLRMADMMRDAGRHEMALEGYRAAIALEERVAGMSQYAQAASAMLPQALDPGVVPQAPTVHVMGLWSHLGAGKSLVALGKEEEAIRELAWVESFQKRKPATVDTGNLVWEPMAQARIALARLYLKRKQIEDASKLFFEGRPFGLAKETDMEYRKVQDEVRQAKNNADAASRE